MFDLPPLVSMQVERPPLVVASAQVRFPLVARLQSLIGVASFQEQIAAFLPYMEQVQQHQILVSVGPLGSPTPPASEPILAWKFTNDEGWVLSLEPGQATLSVDTHYTTGELFGATWQRVLESLRSDALGAARCDRISVRYVNLIDLYPEVQQSWPSWLQPHLTGLVGVPIFSDQTGIRTSVTQTHLINAANEPHPLQGLFRYGFLPQGTQVAFEPLSPPLPLGAAGFLLDTELFVEGHQPFVVETLLRQYDVLHAQQEIFFLWALTPEGREHFGVEVHERTT
jgi:uncharacterized protein (TIGR04255 family)